MMIGTHPSPAPRRAGEDAMPDDPNRKLIATAREAARRVAAEYPPWIGDDEAASIAGLLTRLANRLEAYGRDPRRSGPKFVAPTDPAMPAGTIDGRPVAARSSANRS
jgi:hypothetical protein